MNFKELQIKLNSLLSDEFKSDTLKSVGEYVKDVIKTRTRNGYGVEKSGYPQKKLTPLSPKYKKQRERLKRQGLLSQDTTPNKSNLTKTGDMLDTLQHKHNKDTITVSVSDSNKKKATHVSEKRPFMALSASEKIKIKRIIEEKIISDINKKGL